jgi:hypothetical protein
MEMPVSETDIVERIARVLAAQHLSINADGDFSSAAPDVNDAWPGYQDEALAVLRTLREPDATMAAAGSADTWEAMITAALARYAH